jgi:drug/metabolite transporter (DMT)-like permease
MSDPTPSLAPRRPGAADFALLLLLAAVWGGSFTFIKLAVETIPAATTTLGRLIVATLTLGAIAAIMRERLPQGRELWQAILLAALTGNALPYTLIAWGEEGLDSGLAAILMGVMPLVTVFLAHFLTADEGLTVRKLIGVVLGLVGLVVLIGPDKLAGLGDDVIRQGAVALAACCYAVNALVTRSLTKAPPFTTMTVVMALSAAMLLPVALFADRPWQLAPTTTSIVAMTALGVIQTGLGMIVMLMIVRRQGATFFSQINFLVPIAGVAWGAMALAERPPANAYLALGIILLGVAVARGLGRRSPPLPA